MAANLSTSGRMSLAKAPRESDLSDGGSMVASFDLCAAMASSSGSSE